MFINFIQPLKSAELQRFDTKYLRKSNFLSDLKLPKRKIRSNFSESIFNKFNQNYTTEEFLKENSDNHIAALSQNKEELIIESDKQSEINDIIYAEGNVSVSYKGKLLKADNLIYDKLNKKISANGNIVLIFGEQVLQLSYLEYSFISKKGYLLDVQGTINSNSLFEDLSSNFNLSDLNKIESIIELKNKEVLNTPGKVEKWLFYTDRMTINGKKWESNKALFSNDLLESKQVKLIINSLEVISEVDKLKFKSSLNYLIFDETVSIPFWFGERSITTKSEDFLNVEGNWTVGYENLDKDGYFIGRQLRPINLSDDFVLELEPQFLIHRSLKGYTKSFVNEGDSITSERVKRDVSFKDYFALKSQIKGGVNSWDLEIENNLNSFDIDKLPNAFRSKTSLSKKINFLNSIWNKSFYGIYRDRVWNGSLGEAEIYFGYGSKLQKEKNWIVNGVEKKQFLSLDLANIKAEALNTKSLVTNLKGNLFYSLDQKFPVSIKKPEKKSIDISYRYIPQPIIKGLSLNTKLEASYSFYEYGNHQKHLAYGIGPELVFGNFKNKIFDYTRLSIFPFYKLSSGESVFKFDQNYDDFILNIGFDQQLFGPVILKSIGVINLTNDSENYGEFIDSKISLNWQKRSYEFGIFYKPNNQAGGISFNLFGFK